MNILFRTDSSSLIGTGHIMRDLVLAKQYKKANISFAVQDLAGNINYKIEDSGYEVKILRDDSLKELDRLIKKLNIDLLVFDHYGIDDKFEKDIKDMNPNLTIMVLDDTYEKHYCDILLNHNISGDVKRYKGLVSSQCDLRCGARYTLLRDEFYKQKRKRIRNKRIKKIFVAMGGADHSNINIDILKVIKSFKNLSVNIVTTSANKNLKELKKYCKNKKWINLYINTNKIAKIMRKSDLAIVTPSVTINEVYFMKLPFIAIKTADNQIDMYKYLKKKKKETLKTFNSKRLEVSIKRMIK